jgi:hypothetical protein
MGVALIALSGCTTRSISNSGYQSGGYYGGSSNHLYKGELSEFDILGVEAGREYTDQEIARELDRNHKRLVLRKGDSVLLIQSGALMPDEEMVKEFEKYFSVSLFTGVPEKTDKKLNYSTSLRHAAARAGITTIIAYWGVLESGTRNLATKTVSWVPIVGWGLPDEAQEMRIRLKVATIDVRTGQWEMFNPEVFNDRAYSARPTRASSDQDQVLALKASAYKAAVQGLLARYVQ